MASTSRPLRLAGIAGSLRRGSYNRLLLDAVAERLGPEITFDRLEIGELPPFNEDLNDDATRPAVVHAFKERLAAADGLVIATPEYNYSVPGVLKNALDWASRPVATSPLAQKPVAILGASQGAFGTVRAQLHLRQICVFLDMLPFNKPEVLVRDPATKFDAAGRLVDAPTAALLDEFVAAFLRWVRRLQLGAQALAGESTAPLDR